MKLKIGKAQKLKSEKTEKWESSFDLSVETCKAKMLKADFRGGKSEMRKADLKGLEAERFKS